MFCSSYERLMIGVSRPNRRQSPWCNADTNHYCCLLCSNSTVHNSNFPVKWVSKTVVIITGVGLSASRHTATARNTVQNTYINTVRVSPLCLREYAFIMINNHTRQPRWNIACKLSITPPPKVCSKVFLLPPVRTLCLFSSNFLVPNNASPVTTLLHVVILLRYCMIHPTHKVCNVLSSYVWAYQILNKKQFLRLNQSILWIYWRSFFFLCSNHFFLCSDHFFHHFWFEFFFFIFFLYFFSLFFLYFIFMGNGRFLVVLWCSVANGVHLCCFSFLRSTP